MENLFDNKRITFLKKIRLWWKFEGQYYYSNLKIGIKNIIKWLPIIWNDREYDYSSIYTILKTKLINNSDYLIKTNYHTRALFYAKRMKICVGLIDKLNDGFYSNEYFDYHETKIWFEPINGSDNFELKSEDISENFDEFFKRYPLVYKKILLTNSDKNDKQDIARKICEYNYNRAKKLLFKIIEENIDNWWC